MNLINHMSIFITGESKYEIIITVNVTCMMVLASIYLGKRNEIARIIAVVVLSALVFFVSYSLRIPSTFVVHIFGRNILQVLTK